MDEKTRVAKTFTSLLCMNWSYLRAFYGALYYETNMDYDELLRLAGPEDAAFIVYMR